MGHAAPRANRNPEIVEAKRQRLHEPHIAPLDAFIERLRAERGGGDAIPRFDPDSAGVSASILILMEAPGPRAVGHAARPEKPGSGFISIDNDDPTAENCWHICREAGINYSTEVLPWNVVPWYVGDGKKIRAVRVADIKEAEPALRELISLLPHLRVVVLLGRKAQEAWRRVRVEHLPVVKCPHPSPLVLNTNPAARAQIVRCLRVARNSAGLSGEPRSEREMARPRVTIT